ncbi:cell division protein FtsA [Desnuesiella massiliensis]|uniref:cell division protein FtsA n=1 Tax=Desnuesiella massiliensis TaxID=1650662 RepID=UPI0006E1AD15|nr:cell division protein FtsA [Desnuesiella massiliensis]
MELSNMNPKDVIFSLDIGTRSIIGAVGVVKDKKLRILAEKYVEHEERAMVDGQIHDINLVANTVQTVKSELEKDLGIKLTDVAIAAAGRFLRTSLAKADMDIDSEKDIDKEMVRSLELTAVKKAEEDVNKQTEGKLYCVGYTVKSYYLNGYVISNLLAHKGENISVEVISTFLPRSVVDSLYAVMKKVNLNVFSLTLEPIAAIEAAIPQSLRLLNLALVDIGAGTSDIAISSKDTISAFGMVPMAGDEITEIIAQNYLVDFNTAEYIKKQCSEKENITYTDVLGLENEVTSEEVIRVILPVVEKITEEIGTKIIDLNGGKAPNAVFLVGGGAHTPRLKEFLSKKLNLPLQRIGIKGRDAVSDCICLDNELGSIGVTVLGIALIAIKNSGHDFINVILNGNVISLFNSHKHTVTDVMLQAGINPKILMGRNGKNIRFTLNGGKRLAFGSLASNAEIKINGRTSSLESEVNEGDNIEITVAQDGKDAEPKILDYINNVNAISFFYNDIIQNLEPISFKNGEKVSINTLIHENDEVLIIYPATVGDFKKYFLYQEDSVGNMKFSLREELVSEDYMIKEGDRIYKVIADETENEDLEEKLKDTPQEAQIAEDIIVSNEKEMNKVEDDNTITIVVNDNTTVLKGKGEYVFIDVFDFIDFDLTIPRGRIVLELNGKEAGYYDKLNEGDSIKIYWKQ